MKPSVYFSDSIRYFFKRFSSEISLKAWFLKRAGGESSVFAYPDSLLQFKRTLVFLPRDVHEAVLFLRVCRPFWNKKTTLVVAFDDLREALIHEEHPAEVLYLTKRDFRYGEREFVSADLKISSFAPELSLYLAEPFLPALYLLRHSGALCRIGFIEDAYPFLNVSLKALKNQRCDLLKRLYAGELHG